MDCQEIVRKEMAIEILQTHSDSRLQRLYYCIYSLYLQSFLNWILGKYGRNNLKDKLREDAKDAFQNGIMAFYLKASKPGFIIKASVKTKVYSFGLLQLLAAFKKDRSEYGSDNYLNCLDLLLEDAMMETERMELLNEREQDLMDAISKLPEKQRKIIALKFFDKLKSRQIAEKLVVSPGYVDNESTKAYKALRTILNTKLSAKWN